MDLFIFILGIVAGWLTKIPFLLKWYRELQATKDYRNMKLEERYNKIREEEDGLI
jgi:hypothetical protein